MKKCLAMLLVVIMLLGMLPMSAMATESGLPEAGSATSTVTPTEVEGKDEEQKVPDAPASENKSEEGTAQPQPLSNEAPAAGAASSSNQTHLLKEFKWGWDSSDMKLLTLEDGKFAYDIVLPADQSRIIVKCTRADETSSSTKLSIAYKNTSNKDVNYSLTSSSNRYCNSLCNNDMVGTTVTVTVTDGDQSCVYTINVTRSPVLKVNKITDAEGTALVMFEGKYLLLNGESVVKITANSYGSDLTIGGQKAESNVAFVYTLTGETADIEVKATFGSLSTEPQTIPVRKTDSETVFSGSCGPTATWQLKGDTLTIGGSGAMNTDNSWFGVPTARDVKTIVVGDEITAIANGAFSGCSSCTSVTIGAKVMSIGNSAFNGCSSLTSVTLPADLLSIGDSAFNGCTGISEITIPSKVGSIGASAFAGCSKLSRIELPDSVATVGASAFAKCSALKTAKLPSGLTEIPASLFSMCVELTDVNIPANVTSIGGSAFLSCKKLSSVTLPGKVADIGSSAFSSCAGLTEITIPNSVTTIGTYAFSGCEGLKNVTMSTEVTKIGMYAFQNCLELESVSGLGKITKVENSLFYKCAKLKTIVFPGTVTSFGTSCFDGCKALNNITLPDNITKVTDSLFDDCSSLTEIVIPGDVTEISGSFAGCTSLAKVTLPDGLKTIGMGSFSKCESLATINFPEGLTKISTQAFAGCKALTKVELSETTELSGNAIFFGCSGLKEVTLGKIKNGTAIFGGCTALEKVTFLNGAASFGNQTFNTYKIDKFGGQLPGCTALKSITIPASLTDWGNNAFVKEALANITFRGEGTANFSFGEGIIYNKEKTAILYLNPKYSGEFVVPASMTELQEAVFKGCSNITRITFEEGSLLKAIPSDAFADCTSLKEVVLPAGLESIGTSAFSGCKVLTRVVMPNSITSIGDMAFKNCDKLTSVKLPEGLTKLGWSVFMGTPVTELVLPETLTTLVQNQFGDCEYLKKIEVTGNVTTIPKGAFKPCVSLETLILPASVNKLDNGGINFHNECFNSTTVIYYKGTTAAWNQVDPNGRDFYGTIICNYVAPTTEEGKLVVKSYPENIVSKVEELEGKSISLKLDYPEGTAPNDGDVIVADWYYATTPLDGMKGLKLLSNYSFNRSTMTATVTLSDQLKNNELASWAYYLVVFKTDTEGNTTMFISEPVNVLSTTGGFNLSGEGSNMKPFLIKSFADLEVVATMVEAGTTFNDVYFKLTDDIEIPATWSGMGDVNSGKKFSGILDGDGHTMTFLNDGTKGAKPLINLATAVTVTNLKLKGTAFESSALGFNYSGTVTNCTLLTGTATARSGFIQESGGLSMVGCVVESGVKIGWDGLGNKSADNKTVASMLGSGSCTIVGCSSAADLYGDNVVAGILGSKMYSMRPSIVRNCQFTGTITATGEYIGGIAGKGIDNYSAPNGTCVIIENCLVKADITGARAVGGVFGGEAGIEQAWFNGIGYIRNNVFYGSLTLNPREFAPWDRNTGSSCPADNIDGSIGGIVGFMRSLNVNTVIENNYFYDTNGTAAGIGAVEHIDTTTHPFGYDEEAKIFYYDTQRDDGDEIKNWVDREDRDHIDWQWTSVLTSSGNVHRTDDPMGADADKLGKAMTATTLKDGSVVAALNGNADSLHNWKQGENGPEISSEPVAYKLEIGGDYKTEYYIGDTLDMTGATFTATWTDGKTTNVALSDVSFSGFDSSKRAVLTITAAYKGASAEFEVKILKRAEGGSTGDPNTMTVYFTLLGDYHHEYEDDPTLIHTFKKGNLETWLSKEAYTVDINATVADLLVEVAKKHSNVSFDNPVGNWVHAVTFNGNTMREFDNTDNSGWQYNVNVKHTELLVNQYFLEENDSVIFYWTDDYTQDMGSEGYDNSGNQLGGGSSSEDKDDKVTTELVPSATVDSKGEAKAEVGADDMAGAIESAKKDGADEIVIKPEVKGNANKVTVTIPAASAANVGKDAGADLKLETELGDITIGADDLSKLGNSGELSVSVEKKADGSVSVKVSANGKDVELGSTRVTIGKTNAGAGDVLVIVNADGSETVIRKSAAGKNGVSAVVSGSCTVKLVNRKVSFADTAKHWSKEAAEFAAARGLFDGIAENTFAPDMPMNRAMLATVLHRLESEPASAGKTSFTDKAEGWAEKGIAWAAEKKIVDGYDDGSFRGDNNITRQELAAMLYRYAKAIGMDTTVKGDLKKFTDGSKTADWAEDAMIWAVSNGLFTGKTDSILDPTGNATRAEVAVILQRLIGMMM